MKGKLLTFVLIAILIAAFGNIASAQPSNIALGADTSESDPGWGGGSYPSQIVDGNTYYTDTYAHGLAFTGGIAGWVQPCGWRQATLNFGSAYQFNRALVWHHGEDHIPTIYYFEYWDGTAWQQIANVTSTIRYDLATPPPGVIAAGGATPTEHTFPSVTGSKIRFNLNNCNITHGWIYEFDVFNDPQPPANQPPEVSASQPAVAVNEGQTATNSGNVSDADGDPVALSASIGTVTNNGDGTWNWSFSTSDGPTQSQTVVIDADDGNGGTATAAFDLTVNNVPPTANAGADQTVYRNDIVNVSGTWTDPAGSADNPYTWLWDLSGSMSAGSAAYGDTIPESTSFALEGQYTLTFQVADKDGDNSSDSMLVKVQNRPPVCSTAAPSTDSLWPAQHQMVPVNILGVTDPEGDPVTITITSIAQDEPTNGLGDGDTAPDGQGIGTSTATVRAERSGTGNGRVYHIDFLAGDGHGGSCNGTVLVRVNHDQGKKGVAVDDGPVYDSTTP